MKKPVRRMVAALTLAALSLVGSAAVGTPTAEAQPCPRYCGFNHNETFLGDES